MRHEITERWRNCVRTSTPLANGRNTDGRARLKAALERIPSIRADDVSSDDNVHAECRETLVYQNLFDEMIDDSSECLKVDDGTARLSQVGQQRGRAVSKSGGGVRFVFQQRFFLDTCLSCL